MSAALPNILTAARLLAVPVMVLLLLADNGAEGPDRWWALVVFLIAGATDFLDGYLARRWAVVSTFGKLADPIADKVLILSALAMISLIDGIGWWAFIVLAVREIAVTVGRLMVAGDTVIPASQGGKVKTALQVIAITIFLWPNTEAWVDYVAYALLIASVVLALVTGYDYMRRIVAARRHQRDVQNGRDGSRPDVAA
ncbi:CDP-diacylglycerol--glycerol-3-phosphate 3-phosphatidyltransferase [Demequina aurantiaca]|uniref:CDP-diacylglycerol--glycerol-3-phosphate 3-phosphatidyltransferase n=1 Tax=Demequina aurantiaca TaxID=676200 RepID=UPI003D339E9C